MYHNHKMAVIFFVLFLAKIDESRTVKRQIFFNLFYIREGKENRIFVAFLYIGKQPFQVVYGTLQKKRTNEIRPSFLVLVKQKKQGFVSSQMAFHWGIKIDLKWGLY
jgi:hypothetical protein